jgi:hypothetical protein
MLVRARLHFRPAHFVGHPRAELLQRGAAQRPEARERGVRRQPLRQLVLQLNRQPRNDASTPAFEFLAGINHASDVPVEPDQFRVDGQHGTGLRCLNAQFHVGQQCRETLPVQLVVTPHSPAPPGSCGCQMVLPCMPPAPCPSEPLHIAQAGDCQLSAQSRENEPDIIRCWRVLATSPSPAGPDAPAASRVGRGTGSSNGTVALSGRGRSESCTPESPASVPLGSGRGPWFYPG